MIKMRWIRRCGICLSLLLLLLAAASCAPTVIPGTEPTPTPVPPSPTPTFTPSPTATPLPATASPAPQATQAIPQATEDPEPTQDPDAGMLPGISPNADTSFPDRREVSLYFRMQGEPMLACETRLVTFPKDVEVESELVATLLRGPSAGMLELTALFPLGTKVAKVWHNDTLLYVTLSREFLSAPANAPVLWQEDGFWRQEVYLQRQLGLASIVNTLTEATDFTSVQFLVADQGDEITGRRLLRSEVYDIEQNGEFLGPLARSEHHLLTHFNTANILMECWKDQTFDRLYRFVSQETGQRPTEAAFIREMTLQGKVLTQYAVSSGTISQDGLQALLVASFEYITGNETVSVQNHPVRLIRENGLWKITYAELQRLLEAK